MGRDRNPYRLGFVQVVAVSETDERAEKEFAKHLQAHYRSDPGAIPLTAMAVPGYAEPAAIEGMLRSAGHGGMLARLRTATYQELVDSQVAIVGSPATVADQIEAFVREFRIGNLMVMLQNGSMSRDLTEKSISLFAEEVLPQVFSRLVLLSPAGLWRDDAPIPLMEMVAGPPEELPKYVFAHPESEAARAALALPADPEQIPKAIAQTIWNTGCTTKFAWPIADHGLDRRLHRIQVPTLIVWGREDALVPVAYAKEFGSRIAGSQVEVLDDRGHAVQVDQPERSWTAISGFLAG